MSEIQQILQTLKQPEYVHVLLNPLPVYATSMGVIALFVALLLRSRPAQGVAMLIILIGCLSIWPVMEYGDRAADRVKSMSNAEGIKWLHEHEKRADVAPWVFYPTGALAVVAIIAAWKFPKISFWLSLIVLLAGSICVATGGWISHAGGQIRHTEFRNAPPPLSSGD
jgi:hypothetical protein